MSDLREAVETFKTQLERIDNLEALKRNLPSLVNHDYYKIIEHVLMKKISPSNLLVIKSKLYKVNKWNTSGEHLAFSPEGMRTRYKEDYGHSTSLGLREFLDIAEKEPSIWSDVLQDMGNQNRMTAMKRWSDLVAMSNELMYLNKVTKFIEKDLIDYDITKGEVRFEVNVQTQNFSVCKTGPREATILNLHKFESESIGASNLDDIEKIIKASKVFELATDEFIQKINENYSSLNFVEIDRCIIHIMSNIAKYQIEFDLSKGQ